MKTIAFHRVVKSFAGRRVLKDVTAVCRGGRVTAVAGPNGCGKSTFLHLAAHLMAPDGGRVRAEDDGTELRGEALRRELAFMSPELRLYPKLSAWENLSFFLGLRGISFGASEYEELLERVGLSSNDTERTPIGSFSTGMRQRLHFALMLASGADIWLLDEPGANLDDDGRTMLLREMRRAAEAGKLVLLATNDGRERSAADEIIDLSRH